MFTLPQGHGTIATLVSAGLDRPHRLLTEGFCVRRDMIRLEGKPESVGTARHRVADFIGPDCIRADDIVLMTSELVTNALVHPDSGGTIEVTLREELGQIRVEVKDQGSDRVPEVLAAGLDSLSGRGLAIVDEFADYWSVVSGRSFTVVWFEIWPSLSSAGRS